MKLRDRFLACAVTALLLGACDQEPEPDAVFVSVAMIKGFDPIDAGDQYSGGAQAQVFEGLYQYHYLKRPLQLQPAIADGFPDISEDGLTYTFRLKKGIVYQDDPCFPGGKGREVTAGDFVFCVKRLMGVPSSTGSWLLEGKLAGVDEWAERAKKQMSAVYDRVNEYYPFEHPDMAAVVAEEVEGLRALDDHTLQVTLTEPYPQFMWTLAMIYTVVYPREALDHYGMDVQTHPVGSGPYRVDEYWPFDLRVNMRRNETYREAFYPSEGEEGDEAAGLLKDAGKRLPLLDRIQLRVVENSSPRWLQFLEGSFVRVETEKDIWAEAMTKDGELRPDVTALGVQLHVGAKLDIAYTGFNMQDEIIGAPAGEKGRKVRQAMSLAYNIDGWIKVMRNGFWGMPARGPVPPGCNGYLDIPNAYTTQNLERAKELMAEAGYPDGKGFPALTYEMSGTSATTRNGAEILKDSLKQIGIELKLVGQTWDQFLEKVRNRNAQIYGMAWGADYPDAQNFLQLFYGPNLSPGPNNSNYQNDDYDRLYDEMKLMQPGAERDVVIGKMLEILYEDAVWSFTDHRTQYTYTQEWLDNFKYHPIDFYPLKYYGIDRAAKARRLGHPAPDETR